MRDFVRFVHQLIASTHMRSPWLIRTSLCPLVTKWPNAGKANRGAFVDENGIRFSSALAHLTPMKDRDGDVKFYAVVSCFGRSIALI